MGRPLSRQQFFGADSTNNIKVHFHNGTEGVQGFILRQRSTKHFLCQDANGVQRKCKLVDKVRADLQAGEMSIAFVYDDNTKAHAIKIARHLITVYYDGMYRSMPWTFTPADNDGKWQIDEAGTNTSMAGATDVGNEDFNYLTQYPEPYSGNYQDGATRLVSVTWQSFGVPFEPTQYETGLTGFPWSNGLRRNKALGNFTTNGNTTPQNWNYSFWDTATLINGAEIFDPAMSFGAQTDLTGVTGGENFSIWWVGYVKVPVTQKYNFYIESDDHFGMWIGAAAKGVQSYANGHVFSNASALNGLQHNANSVIMDANRYYPVKFWFSEHSGSCKAQVYVIGENGIKLNGDQLTWVHSSQALFI